MGYCISFSGHRHTSTYVHPLSFVEAVLDRRRAANSGLCLLQALFV